MHYKLELENNLIIGTVEVPVNIDCIFIRNKYFSENLPNYFYDFLITDNHCKNNLQEKYIIKFDYDINDLLNNISILDIQTLLENTYTDPELSVHLSNLTSVNYINYVLELGLDLYTTLAGVIREYYKPLTSAQIL